MLKSFKKFFSFFFFKFFFQSFVLTIFISISYLYLQSCFHFFSNFIFFILRKFRSSFCPIACYIYIKFQALFQMLTNALKIGISDVSKFQKKLHFFKCSRCYSASKLSQSPIFHLFPMFLRLQKNAILSFEFSSFH